MFDDNDNDDDLPSFRFLQVKDTIESVIDRDTPAFLRARVIEVTKILPRFSQSISGHVVS